LAQVNSSSRRVAIIDAAIERFGRDGYEDTKWADIAADVGVGPTALYHYFGSKQHCLFVILDDAVQIALARFERITHSHPDPARALRALIADAFDVTPHDVQRMRVLVAEHGLLLLPRSSQREEEARQAAGSRTRALELAWAGMLAGAMERGSIPQGDSRLLARALLGLYNSIWQWYRPHGMIPLEVVADFYRGRMLGLLGLPPDAVP
jgi:AcrR family transcriptional regulator